MTYATEYENPGPFNDPVTVAQLIEELSKFDPAKEVVIGFEGSVGPFLGISTKWTGFATGRVTLWTY